MSETENRLAAELAADMVGYSRLMEEDERGTLARLRTHRLELIDPVIAKNRGRIVKTTGDGTLAEFQSVVDAVRSALEIQQRMMRRNSDVEADRRIEFRIGINLGDIIFEDDDIFGDGVNIAARVEALADVGGICVTQAVRDQVGDRIDVQFEDLGDKSLKNIARPIRVYRVLLEQSGEVGRPAAPEPPRTTSKPRIAVLPFANMSGDPEQEFFADGLTEDIITELSRRRELFVISRTSSFVYKGQVANLQGVAHQLGAQYLVEGSVRRAGNRLRITVQLIDTATDAHIWAERYDREIDDIFAIQDNITTAIVATLPGRLEAAQQDVVARKKPKSLHAYECVLAAKVLHHRSTRESNLQAQAMIARALELDPDYGHAHAWRGCILGQAWGYGWYDDEKALYQEVVRELEKARALDEDDADTQRILAALAIVENNLALAQIHQDRAYALNPNYDLVVVQMGELYTWNGRVAEGIDWIKRAIGLNPHHPLRFWAHLGRAYFTARQYAQAVEVYMRVPSRDAAQQAFVAASYCWLGDETAARAHADKVLELDPGFTVERFLEAQHYGDPADLQHLREGLTRAGLV